jgi:deoxyribonuclease-4
MYFGAHVSAAGGVDKAPERAAAWGCEVFQIFSRPPQGGPAPKLTPEIIARYRRNVQQYKQHASYIHTPYFVNFASTNNRIRFGTVSVVREELERGTLLGCQYVMTHLGSARDVGLKRGVEMTVAGLVQILKDYRGTTELLVEISAGSGETLGDTFEEIAAVVEQTEKNLKRHGVLNVCFDTQHAFASGYDLRTRAAVKETVKKFDAIIGLERLKMSHCNDSKVALGAHVDRHENLGRGALGWGAFRALVAEPKLKHVSFVLETPRDETGTEVRAELRTLKKLRDT